MSYRSLWRRICRRNHGHLFRVPGEILSLLARWASLLALLIPSWGGMPLAGWARWGWFVLSLFSALLLCIIIPIRGLIRWMGEEISDGETEWLVSGLRGYTVWITLLAQIAVMVSLSQGNIAWAFVFEHLPSAYCKIDWCLARRTAWLLPSALSDLLIVGALPLHALFLGFAGLTLSLFSSHFIKPSLRESLRGKLTIAKYRQRIGAALRKHPEQRRSLWRQSHLVRQLADLEQWEDAQRLLDLYRQDPARKPEEDLVLQARLDCGQGRYEEVLKLNEA